MSRPVLEFLSAQRAPFQLSVNDVVVGRSPACTLILDAAGVADRHARITVDAGGTAYIENFEADAFTMYNGGRLIGKQKLSEGDRVEIGLAQLVYHADLDPSVVSNAPAGAKAANADRTMLGSEMPPELKKFLEQRQVGGAQANVPPDVTADAWETAPPTVAEVVPKFPQRTIQVDLNSQVVEDRAAGGVMVGKPEPEPPAHRTVQMAPQDVAKLNLPKSDDPVVKAAPSRPQFKQTMMGIGTPVAKATPTPAPPPNKAAPQQATAFMEAPKLPAQPPTGKAAPQQATAFMEAPKLPAQPATGKAPPQQPTAFMDAPKLPGNAPHATAPTLPVATGPASAGGFPPATGGAPYTPAPAPMPYTPAPAPMPYSPAPAPMPYSPAPAPTPYSPAAAPMPGAQGVPGGAMPYSAPKSKGSFGSFSRAFEFMSQIVTLAKGNSTLLKPLVWDLAITTPIMFVFAILDYLVWRFTGSATLGWIVLGVEAFLLYFVDYLCNSITCSLMYDYATTGTASTEVAIPRVKKALPGVITFAAVSALLDVASTYARERNDVVSKIVLRVLRAVWTTATYVIMPALVIEGVSFGAAFGRSKKLMDQDPTGVGAGVVALSIISYAVAAVCFPLAYFIMSLFARIPVVGIPLGAFLGMAVINLYWSVSGWLKISYATCFYLWARECEAQGRQDASLAPAPLRAALEAA
jgi:hypothetical protein